MRTMKLAGLAAGLSLALSAGAAAAGTAPGADFPGPLDFAAVLAASPVPPAARAEDAPVWVTVSDEDLKALGPSSAFTVKKAAARGGLVSVFQLDPAELPAVSEAMHDKFHKCGGFFTHDSFEAAKAALLPAPAPATRAYTLDRPEQVRGLLALAGEEELTRAVTALSAYKNRYYTSVTGIDASKWLQSYWKRLATGRSDISVEPYRHAAWGQESVILTVQGASEPGEIIVLGGHLDSIARGGGDVAAPGADDNASGVAALSEAIRVIAASGYRPARTLKFIAYAAEEVGLRGSQEIAAAYKRDGLKVTGVIQLDMTNYNGSDGDIFLVTDNTNAAQNAFLGALVRTYTDYRLGETRCGYACSDHASWTRNGYAASFPFESRFGENNPYVHTAEDTLGRSGGNTRQALKFTRLALAYLVEMAK